jgi:hypothetical protein
MRKRGLLVVEDDGEKANDDAARMVGVGEEVKSELKCV